MQSQDDPVSSDTQLPMPIKQYQTKSHEQILNVIDSLRSEGISNYVDIPQMIVCGDQSSGKSSVLEAISGLGFPRKEGLCTRFVTELILRRDAEKRIEVSILPNRERPEEEQKYLENFEPSRTAPEQFGAIVTEAKDAMDKFESKPSFLKDVLRVELCGPTQPHLTLVDLPGLYHAPDEKQDEDGIECVEYLVRSYIEKPRSIILAVISGQNQIALQKVTALIKKFDPNGNRTLGIITKPDTLHRNSERERSFSDLANNRNSKIKFQLGWHVLKNRSDEEEGCSLADRNKSEEKFLSQGIWASLEESHRGIETLVPKLCNILIDHIQSQMPSFITDTKTAFKETSALLSKLGDKRDDFHEQVRFLRYGSQRFTTLMNDSLNGVYCDPFFGSSLIDDCYGKRLRAVIQDRLRSFAETMDERGHSVSILEEDLNLENGQECTYRTDYVESVRKRMRRNRGRELPGNFNPLIIGELFYEQAQPWEDIVNEYTENLLSDVRNATIMILADAFSQRTVEKMMKHFVNGRLSQVENRLYEKISELLKPQQSGHPITYNSQYIKNIQEMRNKQSRDSMTRKIQTFFGEQFPIEPRGQSRLTFCMQDLIDKLSSETESDMERFACSDAIGCMLAYYRVAMEKFVDDFSNLAVEECLVTPLRQMFRPSAIEQLKRNTIKDIACEDEDTRAEREKLTKKQDVLRRSLRQMNEYNLKVRHLIHESEIESEHEDSVVSSGEEDESYTEVDGRRSPLAAAMMEAEETSNGLYTEENVEIVPDPEPDEWLEPPRLPTKKKKKQSLLNSAFDFS